MPPKKQQRGRNPSLQQRKGASASSRSPIQYAAASMLNYQQGEYGFGQAPGQRLADGGPAKASKHLEAALGFADRNALQARGSQNIAPTSQDEVSDTMARINAALGLSSSKTELGNDYRQPAATNIPQPHAGARVRGHPKFRTSNSAPSIQQQPNQTRSSMGKGRGRAAAAAQAAEATAKKNTNPQSSEHWMYQLQVDGMEPRNRRRGRKSPKRGAPSVSAPAPAPAAVRPLSSPGSSTRPNSSDPLAGIRGVMPHPDVLKILGPPPKKRPTPVLQPKVKAPAAVAVAAPTAAQLAARTNWKPKTMGTTNARLRRKIGYFVKKAVPPLIEAGLRAALLHYRTLAAALVAQCAVRQFLAGLELRRRRLRLRRRQDRFSTTIQCAWR